MKIYTIIDLDFKKHDNSLILGFANDKDVNNFLFGDEVVFNGIAWVVVKIYDAKLVVKPINKERISKNYIPYLDNLLAVEAAIK